MKDHGFGEDYWKENYSEPLEMDGIANADRHAQYIKSFFDVEYVDINSIIDFGFGLGHLFDEVNKIFKPYKSYGLEPSLYAYEKASKRLKPPTPTTKFKLKHQSIKEWVDKSKPKSARYDLGICTSVLQYLSEEEINEALPVMAKRVKYLYLSVPTDKELDQQINDLDFFDRFALRRSQKTYLKLLKPHFTVIGNRVLESKHFYSLADTHFTDYLFRFND
jgi:hypothetical protein